MSNCWYLTFSCFESLPPESSIALRCVQHTRISRSAVIFRKHGLENLLSSCSGGKVASQSMLMSFQGAAGVFGSFQDLRLWSRFRVYFTLEGLPTPRLAALCVLRCSMLIGRSQSFWLLWPMGVGQCSTHSAGSLSVKRYLLFSHQRLLRWLWMKYGGCVVLAVLANACCICTAEIGQRRKNDWAHFPTHSEKATHVGFEALV